MFPVAMQKVAEAQETDVRCAGAPLTPNSSVGADHLPPEYVYRKLLLLVATQKPAVGHDTHDSPLVESRCGADHEPPAYVKAFPPESAAAQKSADAHDTEVRPSAVSIRCPPDQLGAAV